MKAEKSFEGKIFYVIGALGAVASIIGFVYAFTIHPDWKGLYISITASIYSMVLVSILVYLVSERKKILKGKHEALLQEKYTASLRSAYHNLHSISHEFRDEYQRLRSKQVAIGELKNRKFLICVLDNMKYIFEGITDAPCCSCIKVHVPSTRKIVTLARDAGSATESGQIDYYRESTVESNTASQRIINDKIKYFFSNNLLELRDAGHYKNDRADWWLNYKSTIVWPIRYFHDKEGKHDIPALLCLDSKETGVFDEYMCFHVGACVADMLYAYFSHENINWELLTKGGAKTRSDVTKIPIMEKPAPKEPGKEDTHTEQKTESSEEKS